MALPKDINSEDIVVLKDNAGKEIRDQTEAKLADLPEMTGEETLNTVLEFQSRFICYPSVHAAVTHALWTAHAHLTAFWFTTPRLGFMSQEKESGKSRALEVTELLVPGPLLSVNISPAALVRKVDEGGVTVLFDEIDALFGSASREENNVDVRSILNAGYREGAKVHRCVGQGTNQQTREFNAFAPVALAGLRHLPDTLASRTIIVRMKKRKPDEHVEPFRLRKLKPEADRLKALLRKWCLSVAKEVGDAEPEMPKGIVDRAAECWEPLLALADAAGGSWPEKARRAAWHITAGAIDETRTPGVELLEHCREAFDGADDLRTAELLQRLHDRDESPWKDVRGKPLTDRGLAQRLKGYEIRSRNIRDNYDRVFKGYLAADFRDAWERHLPPLMVPATSATSATNMNNKDKGVAAVAAVADRRGEMPETLPPETVNKIDGDAAEMPLDFSGKRLSNASAPPAGGWSIDADD